MPNEIAPFVVVIEPADWVIPAPDSVNAPAIERVPLLPILNVLPTEIVAGPPDAVVSVLLTVRLLPVKINPEELDSATAPFIVVVPVPAA